MPKQRARNAQATSDRFGCSISPSNNNDDTRRFAIRFAFDGTVELETHLAIDDSLTSSPEQL
jgi:hypothetical protein